MIRSPKPTILIVEDLANWREVLTSILVDDYVVLEAISFDEANKALDAFGSSIDLIIADIRLDDRSAVDEGGLRLLELVNNQYSWISTIVLTGYPTLKTLKKAIREYAAFDYLEKYPSDGEFDITRFRATTREAVESTRVRKATQSTQQT